MKTHNLEWYDICEVYVNELDVADYLILQHDTPVLESKDLIWSEEIDHQGVYVVGNKLIVEISKRNINYKR